MKKMMVFLMVTFALVIHYPLASWSEEAGSNPGGQAPASNKPQSGMREKVAEFQKLLKEKKDAGMDVSQAAELGKQSRDAGMSGDDAKSASLLDQAISLLKGTASTTGTTTNTSKTTKPASSASGSAQPAATAGGQSTASNKPQSGMREKVTEFQKLVKEKKDSGMDVSKAQELGKQSRDAGMSGDNAKAESLMDQALALLKGSAGATTTGTVK